MPLRVIFMGTAELACASLQALLASPKFSVQAVVTQPDRPKGRDLKLTPSEVKKVALAANIPVLQPERAREPQFIEQLKQLAPDYIVVIAYGQILPRAILDTPKFGCVNVHTSLLPQYRGAAPIQAALLNGDPETGVTIMQMDEGLDTGPILSQHPIAIEATDDAATLHDKLAIVGAEGLLPTLLDFAAGKIQARPQNHSEATHVKKIKKEDGQLDWKLPARVLQNRIRAFTPWPGAFTFQKVNDKARLLKVWRAEVVSAQGEPGTVLAADNSGVVVACGQDALRILRLQREGGRQMSAAEFLQGNSIRSGEQFVTSQS
ncbi:MAG: Methionyl-tRNA formyltransferase [Verrucomicrobiales bacterium]|nr:Methionyl-tRNA formyltransferase [Verrucomicrobiales bacterium]